MDHEASLQYAKKYLEDLLSFFEVNVEVAAHIEGDVIELNVPSTESNSILIGRNAETLRSMQYAVSTTLRNQDAALVRELADARLRRRIAQRGAADQRPRRAAVRASLKRHL